MGPSDGQTQTRNDDHPAGLGVRRSDSALWAWWNECVRRNLVRATGCSVPPRDIRWIQRPQPAPGWGRFRLAPRNCLPAAGLSEGPSRTRRAGCHARSDISGRKPL
jgi:hypothetical protein